MQDWTSSDARAGVWGAVCVDHMRGEALNASVYAPIAAHFPAVKLSNFGAPGAHHSDPTGIGGPPPAGGEWPYVATSSITPAGVGAHVGTAQSHSIYGAPNNTLLSVW